MRDYLPENGRIRKLWAGETGLYRDHLKRLDAKSRNSRFGAGVSDTFIDDHVLMANGLDSVIHGFFVDDALRGAAELRPLGPGFGREPKWHSAWSRPGRATASARLCFAGRC